MVRDQTETDADAAITELYSTHYVRLVRLATLLQGNNAVAEDVVQDAFVALHRRWRGLRDPDNAVAYLRTSVVHGSRTVQRRHGVAARHRDVPSLDEPSAEHWAVLDAATAAVIGALHRLPRRQREALVLRYYAGLSEAEIAEAMKISRGAVKSHASRGLSSLRHALVAWL